MSTLHDPGTPFAVVDRNRLRTNVTRLRDRLKPHGVILRPHVKTAKSIDVARLVFDGGPGPITVSTLAEAEAFADAGFTDITYAVGIDPHKLPRVRALYDRGVTVTVLLDSLAQAVAVAECGVPALIEVDCDGHRGGVAPMADDLLTIGEHLASRGCLEGVLLHAGESYFAYTPGEMAAAAANEREVAVRAATRLREAGLTVPTVSIGSTPTAHALDHRSDLTGITEVRAGNYVFFDLVMAGIGVCALDDLALSVVVTVIGHQPGRVLTDGGWMATSRDRGTARQPVDQGYGLVSTLDGTLLPGLRMTDASQEHGTLTTSSGELPDLPLGTRLRILPNHACATAAQHRGYTVVDGNLDITGTWPRVQGW
ncbi:alanine racemase [Kineosporia succinea]|uniref:D-serine deaminase-like pyridoxal phosphate-dependent protein n=1 Tax=Kineosporia succinea TaxID=84632 RepID=A0ABT9PFQ6_9ACTN|nr:alanine racemase [Kineosporia succinea]MDP9831224.1 D-serine deaminase-like pyridoxal phosphate-dependent protein [Kineosporia succinea]